MPRILLRMIPNTNERAVERATETASNRRGGSLGERRRQGRQLEPKRDDLFEAKTFGTKPGGIGFGRTRQREIRVEKDASNGRASATAPFGVFLFGNERVGDFAAR
mmetsp:Transcript_18637/g.43103  ORF Transcript_18637/g.43103 Transcript_18637/m.43103 type:complete len:106 (-) Transcript_18637:325-642(-)